MPQARATSRRTTLEKRREKVLADLVLGLTQEQVATKYAVNPSSVHRFVHKYSSELTEASLAVETQAHDYAIARKVERIAVKDQLATLLLKVREARANGSTGEETGLVVKTYKQVGNGRNAQLVEEWKIDPALVSLIDQLHHSTAEELGDLPKPDQNLNIRAQVLLRQVEGTTEELG